jgi:5-methylcytosine-specific restriction enzyme A
VELVHRRSALVREVLGKLLTKTELKSGFGKTLSNKWKDSDRKLRLPSNWNSLRKKVLVRDNHKCTKCGYKATQVDHIVPGDNHSLDNLQSLCTQCHGIKSSLEGVMARQRNKSLRQRPSENHPGRRAG